MGNVGVKIPDAENSAVKKFNYVKSVMQILLAYENLTI
jgi:hypothetical protein